MKVYVVMRIFQTRFGDRFAVPLDGAYTDKGEADKDVADWNRKGAALLSCRLVSVGKEAVDAGLDVQEYLDSLGFVKIEHRVMVRELRSKFVDPDEIGPLARG